MLTIREKIPIKKMALYGSTAVLVGFAGTYTMLREIFPYDNRENVADINWERKQAASGSAIKPAAESSDGKSADTSNDALKESGMVVSQTPSTSQTPAKSQPFVATPSTNSGPITATPSVTAPQPAPTPTPVEATPTPQPEPQPTPVPVIDPIVPPVVPLIESTTKIIIDGVVQP